jgi:hypothetical protein
VASGTSGIRAATRKLVKLFRRDGTIVAFDKILRYLEWQVPAQIRRWRLLRMATPEDRFTFIYRTNFWNADQSVSGPAGSLENTAELRARLPGLFERHGIRRLFDAPCGDFHWMRHLVAEHPLDYVGGDIVRMMVERNQMSFGSERVAFLHIDITRDAFPAADLWLCRASFCNLSQADVFAALQRFAASDIRYMLASCTNPDGFANTDIVTGDYRRIDLQSPPYSLPRELARLKDGDDEMCLWSREQVAEALERYARANLVSADSKSAQA